LPVLIEGFGLELIKAATRAAEARQAQVSERMLARRFHALLREKQAEFLAILELAEQLADFELSRESQDP
jgi:hypothetical protein